MLALTQSRCHPTKLAKHTHARETVSLWFVVFETNQHACLHPITLPPNKIVETYPCTNGASRHEKTFLPIAFIDSSFFNVIAGRYLYVMKADKYWYNTLVYTPVYLDVQVPYYIPQAY